jgi:preprotein translocase subunit YajC
VKVQEIVLAQTGQESAPSGDGGAGGIGFFLPLIALFLLMYAIIIRPQQRQQKEHKKMVAAVQRGDTVVTNGGLHGKVTGVADDVLTVEIAERVRVKLNRSAVASRTSVEKGAES